jgi:hypothetical protein
LAALVLAVGIAGAQSPPPSFPALFYGTLVVNGEPPPEDSRITAYIDGVNCTQPDSGRTALDGQVAVYSLTVMHESQKPGCGAPGRMITFRIDDEQALQQATWGPASQQVNLSIGEATPPPLPSPTVTPTPDPTDVVATQTQAALFTPVPAPSSLPTDDPDVIGAGGQTAIAATATAGGPPASGGRQSGRGSDGGSVTLWALGILGLIVIAGSAGGIALSRKQRQVSDE